MDTISSLSSQPGADRVSFVTGATSGIGRAVALQLARGGDRVIASGRNAVEGGKVLAHLQALRPERRHAFVAADLSLLGEAARLADQVAGLAPRLDAIVCCAGDLSTIPEWTGEQLERSFVLNYLSRYLLVRRLLPQLSAAKSGRVVLVANAGRYPDSLEFDDLQYRRGRPGLKVAGRSQFANDLLAIELASRLERSAIDVSCVFPGAFIDSGVFRNARGFGPVLRAILIGVQRLLRRSPDWAAQTPVYLAQSPEARGCNGQFFGPERRPLPVPARARRSDRRSALWAASETLVATYLPAPSPGLLWRE